MGSMKEIFNSLFLKELLKGMSVTGKYFFARKITVQYPEEKTPQSFRFRGCTPCVAILTVKSAVLHANFARLCVLLWQLRSRPNHVTMDRAAPLDMTSILPSVFSVVSAKKLARLMQSSRRDFRIPRRKAR
jgi:hypothetical protein